MASGVVVKCLSVADVRQFVFHFPNESDVQCFAISADAGGMIGACMTGMGGIVRWSVHVNQRLILSLPGFTVILADVVLPVTQMAIVPVVYQSFAAVYLMNFWVGDRGGNPGSNPPLNVIFCFY